MDKAHSIFYGTIVDAEDCNRSSYKKLGLQCAVEGCGATVILAGGEHQKLHFRHRAGEGKPDCEERAQKMSAQDWEKRQRQAEQQFHKVLQAQFWTIYTGVYSTIRWDVVEHETRAALQEHPYKAIWQQWNSAVFQNQEGVVDTARVMCDALVAGNYSTHELKNTGALEEANSIIERIHKQSQQNSVVWALEFLLQRRQMPLLQMLFYYSMNIYTTYAEREAHKFPRPDSTRTWEQVMLWILVDIIATLSAIPWAQAADSINRTGAIPLDLHLRNRPKLDGLQALQHLGEGTQGIFSSPVATARKEKRQKKDSGR